MDTPFLAMAADTGAMQRAKTGRAGGRNVLQEDRRQRTREALIAAAGQVFGEKPYLSATIDDILTAAKVSRATFYVHFESKLALAWTIIEGITDNWRVLFDELPAIDPTDVAAITRWIDRLVGVYRAHGYISVLFVQLDHFEREFHGRVVEMRNALIEHLGQRLPAFRAALQTDEPGAHARARAHLMFQRLDYLCSELSLRGRINDADYMKNVVAEELATFLSPRDVRVIDRRQ